MRKAVGTVLTLLIWASLASAQVARRPVVRPVKPAAPMAGVSVVPPDLRQVAQDTLDSMRGEDGGWTATAKLGPVFPIHLPGVDEPAYFEFKVVDGSADAGYILVNANEMDILVPEAAVSGPTLSEAYRRHLPDREFRVFRYGFFESAARQVGDDVAVLASAGFTGTPGQLIVHVPSGKGLAPVLPRGMTPEERLSPVVESLHAELGQSIRTHKVVPVFQPDGLREYYRQMGPVKSVPKAGAGVAKSGGGTPGNHRLWSQFHPGWHTPAWYQTVRRIESKGYDCPVGCGPAAWVIALAYWKQFKGKDRLFETDLSGRWNNLHGEPDDVMWRLSELMNTDHSRYWSASEGKWSYFGRTWLRDMDKGIRYVHEKGYREATVVRHRSGERSKFWEIDAEIAADRPVILTVHAKGEGDTGYPNHYVIVEQTRYMADRVGGTFGYWVNMCHGNRAINSHKWLFTRQRGTNASAYSAFFIRMEDEGGPRPFRIVVDRAAGRNMVPGTQGRNQQVQFHLENFKGSSRTASVQLIVDGVLLRTFGNLEEMVSQSFTLPGEPRSFTLRARLGGQTADETYHFDYRPPTVGAVRVNPVLGRPGSVTFLAEGVQDDGYWNATDYEVAVWVNGVAKGDGPGTSYTVDSLRPGNHAVRLTVRDGFGRESLPVEASFTVGSHTPTVQFVAPAEGATVRRGSTLELAVEAGGGPGIMRVSIYLDRVSTDEFDPTRVCVIPGPFGRDRPVRQTCTTRVDWSRGRHTLIAVFTDNEGRDIEVRRTIRVR